MSVVLGVRHGEVHNPDGVIYAGLAGYGLSDLGRRQAESVAADLAGAGVAVVYASPLERAAQTARVIADACGLEVVTDDRLHEWRFWSRWAGLTWAELRDQAQDDWNAYQNDPGSVTEGESLRKLGARMLSWLADVRAAHPDQLVVGVSHLEPLRALLLERTGRPPGDLFGIKIGLGEAVRLDPAPDPTPGPPSELARLRG